MNGLKTVLLWLFTAALVAAIAQFEAVMGWTKANSEFAAWVQAIGSVAAIFLAVWVVDRQHRLQNQRADFDRLVARVAVYDGVVQLMTAIYRIAEKIKLHSNGESVQAPAQGPAGAPGTPSSLGLEIMCVELETAIAAVSKTDYLMLAEHLLIKGLQVSESSAKNVLYFSREQLTLSTNAHQIQWHIPVQLADLCMRSVRPLIDEIYEQAREMSGAGG